MTENFRSSGAGWGDGWFSPRYQTDLARRDRAGVIAFPPATPKAVTQDKTQIEYMGAPVLVRDLETSEVEVAATVELDGRLEAGVVCRAGFDRCYALLVRRDEALLCRYDIDDRVVLDRTALVAAGPVDMRLETAGERVSGSATVGGRTVELSSIDDDPLPPGLVGALANPLDVRRAASARVTDFSASSPAATQVREARLLYGFAGAVTDAGDGTFEARVTALTEVPSAIAFDFGAREDLSDATRAGPFEPHGGLGSVHAVLEGLKGGATYHWRPVFRSGSREVDGPTAVFRTPPVPGRAASFVFASCTSGRVAAYPSFTRARDVDPDFFLHGGDWGYADLTATIRSGDHFQARWIRLLRTPEVAGLVARSPLMFWQDDHDYQADNGWAETVQPYTITAFDELHANPTDRYFDVRWGDLHVWCLDCRMFASDPEAPDDARKTRIGSEQKEWLMRGMSESDAPVRVVASAMAFRNKVDGDPGWHNVYTTERDELLAFFAQLDATTFILSGDSHGQRLIHHFEFGDLFEITSSGTDFPPGAGQGDNDPEHTIVSLDANGIALVRLDPAGVDRNVTIQVIAPESGEALISKRLPVR